MPCSVSLAGISSLLCAFPSPPPLSLFFTWPLSALVEVETTGFEFPIFLVVLPSIPPVETHLLTDRASSEPVKFVGFPSPPLVLMLGPSLLLPSVHLDSLEVSAVFLLFNTLVEELVPTKSLP